MNEAGPVAPSVMPTSGALSGYFRVAAVLFAIAGAVHFYQFVTAPAFSAFHATFALLDPAVAWLMIRRPLWFVYVFPAFVAQQIYAHGSLLAQSIRDGGFDAVSALIVLFMLLTAVLLFADRARRSRLSA